MSNMLLTFGICFALASFSCVDCTTCLHCTDIENPRHCKHVRDCPSEEVCHIQQTISKYGEVVFDLGCTESSTCSNRSQGNRTCDECCSTNLCNAAGCGQPGYPSSRGPICYSCSAQTTEGSCHTIDFCNTKEVCMVSEEQEFGDRVYPSRCATLTHCENVKLDVAPIIGRSVFDDIRSLTEITCHKCCHGDLCNANCRTRVDYCASNPCVYGRCVSRMTGYTCDCDQMYNGQNCSEVDYCASNPCVHGRCVNGMTGYTCDCDPMYNGQNCSVLDYCASIPCMHGRCMNGITGYTCVCDQPYIGQNCSDRDYCQSNPCVHGRCHNRRMNYSCVCERLYIGINCSERLKKDCLALKSITQVNGVYTIQLEGSQEVIDVYCDMTTDGGGWTVFQRRVNGSVDFFKNFLSYENGFGNVNGEFWMGLKYIHVLTSTTQSELRIDLMAADGSTAYEVFSNFRVSASPDYRLHIDRGNGTAGDAHGLSYNNGDRFSTFDNDISNINCTYSDHGGWWYKGCTYTNLNGKYGTPGQRVPNTQDGGVFYYDFKNLLSLKETKMMLRRI